MALGLVQSDDDAQQRQDARESAAAAMGLVIRLPRQQTCEELYLWPENVVSWNLFQAVSTQWEVNMAGATGLRYPSVEIVMRLAGVKRRDRERVFNEIQCMERATLSAWREKSDGS